MNTYPTCFKILALTAIIPLAPPDHAMSPRRNHRLPSWMPCEITAALSRPSPHAASSSG